MIEVHVQRRNNGRVILVLKFRQLIGQQTNMVVVHQRHRSENLGIRIRLNFLDQFIPDQVSKRFRAIRITPLFDETVELVQKFLVDCCPDSGKVRHNI